MEDNVKEVLKLCTKYLEKYEHLPKSGPMRANGIKFLSEEVVKLLNAK